MRVLAVVTCGDRTRPGIRQGVQREAEDMARRRAAAQEDPEDPEDLEDLEDRVSCREEEEEEEGAVGEGTESLQVAGHSR